MSADRTRQTFYFSVGEPSGDTHAAHVVEALQRDRSVEVIGSGGPRMQRAGAHVTLPIDRMSAIGFAEVAATVPRHARFYYEARSRFKRGDCSAVVLVDYPGYNLRLATAASQARLPVLYYIAPQLWAWGGRRIRRMRRDVTHLAVILPFEERFFARQGVPATFVGHPLLDRPSAPSKDEARLRLGLDTATPVLGLFPASRRSERSRLEPLFQETAQLVRAAIPSLQIATAELPDNVNRRGRNDSDVSGPSELVMAAADFALCKSGTTTLEAAIARKPFCIAYQMHRATYQVARRLIATPHIGLINIVLERRAIPEFVQHEATVDALSRSLLEIADPDSSVVRDQLEAMEEACSLLGAPGAGRRVADLVQELAA